tara:strand:- start:259 stop:702 length:444 start_codon:yes stop_codon:yes gene_type:complete
MSAQQQNKVLQLATRTTANPIDPFDISLSAEFWAAGPFLKAALEYAHNSHDLNDVFRLIIAGDAQFWKAEDAGLVTEIIDYPKRRTLRFWLAGGNLESLKTLEQNAIEWSRQFGCVSSEIIGRRGWVRSLEGYEEAATVMVKDFNHE